MSNLIDIHKYLQSAPNHRIREARYTELIDWVTDNVGPAMSVVPQIPEISRGQFGCMGDGWKILIHNLEHPDLYSQYKWYMEIKDDTLAVAFKLLYGHYHA